MQTTHPLQHSVALFCILATGCSGEDGTGIPQPFPLPKPKVQLLRANGAMSTEIAETINLVGLPGTVARAGSVFIEDPRGNRTEASSADSGSFATTLQARATDLLSIWFETSEAAEYEVQQLGIMAPRPPGPAPGVPPLTGPTGGTVTVSGLGSDSASFLLVNLDSGDVGLGSSDQEGLFELQVAASSGDHLSVWEDQAILLGAWELTVP